MFSVALQILLHIEGSTVFIHPFFHVSVMEIDFRFCGPQNVYQNLVELVFVILLRNHYSYSINVDIHIY